jgi:taurine dioxygenase
MAPYLQEETTLPSHEINNIKSSSQTKPTKTLSYEPGRTIAETHENYAYDHLLPTFPDVKWDPLTEVPYSDKGLLGSPDFSSLLATATSIRDYNPKIGTEVSGIDLANLTDAQKNDIARLIATRGVVFFRNQKNFNVQKQRELGQYFGTLHRHATTSVPKQQGLEDVHVVFAEGARGARNHIFSPSFLWHSDVSCVFSSMGKISLLTLGLLGHLRTPTPFIHKSKTPQRSPQRRRRYNTLVIPIRSL